MTMEFIQALNPFKLKAQIKNTNEKNNNFSSLHTETDFHTYNFEKPLVIIGL